MTKPRFGNFIPAALGATDGSETVPAPPETAVRTAGEETVLIAEQPLSLSETLAPVLETPRSIPAAPIREERRAFSTRVRPSQKAMLDRYVMDLKQAGWPVSQEGVLDELLVLLAEDEHLRERITARLARV